MKKYMVFAAACMMISRAVVASVDVTVTVNEQDPQNVVLEQDEVAVCEFNDESVAVYNRSEEVDKATVDIASINKDGEIIGSAEMVVKSDEEATLSITSDDMTYRMEISATKN